MRDVHITVEVELRRSDGNYGSDRAMCQLGATLDADDGIGEMRDYLLGEAARGVELQLAGSASLEVRRTMLRKPRLCYECEQPLSDGVNYLHADCEELQRERRKREDQERRAQWEAEQFEYQRQRELAGVGAATDDDDEPDDDGDISL